MYFLCTLAQKDTDVPKLLILNMEVYGSKTQAANFFFFLSSLCGSTNIFKATHKEKLRLVAVKLNLTRQTHMHVLFLCLFVEKKEAIYMQQNEAQGRQHLLDVFSVYKNRSQQYC